MKGRASKLLSVLIALSAPAAVCAQATPIWASIPDVPPLPTPSKSGFVEHDGAHIYFAVLTRAADGLSSCFMAASRRRIRGALKHRVLLLATR